MNNNEPESFVTGDTSTWTKELPEYLPSDGWVLSYAFVLNGVQVVITTTDNGDGSHLANINKVDSAKFVAGQWNWQAHVDNGTDHQMVDSGRVDVLPSFIDATTGYDGRSHAQKTLDAIEAVIEERATKDQQSYTIQGTSIARMPITDLIRFRAIYRNKVKEEKIAENLANGLGSSRTIKVRLK